MNNRSIQLVTVVVFMIAIFAVVQIVRRSFRAESPQRAEVIGGIDVQGNTASQQPMQDLGVRDEGDSYSKEATTTHLVPGLTPEDDIDDDDQLTEEECLAFIAHVERISGGSGSKSEAGSVCKETKVPAEFARCAMTKSSQAELVTCGGIDDPEAAARESQKLFRKALRDIEEAGLPVDPSKITTEFSDDEEPEED